MVPLLQAAAERYRKAHPDVQVHVSADGSKIGLAKVASGMATIGSSDLFADGEQAESLEDHRVAVVGFGVMARVGPYNENVRSLTHAQVEGIFTGRIKSWSELGGQDQPIQVINRKRSSGTRAVFASVMLGGDRFADGTPEEDSSSTVQNLLLSRTGSISYLGLSYTHPQLRIFALDGVAPTIENVQGGTYPLWSYEHLYTKKPAPADAKAFIDFILTREFQASILPKVGFIPIDQMKVNRLQD
jgi:phosphate transport system substrate-binding protein